LTALDQGGGGYASIDSEGLRLYKFRSSRQGSGGLVHLSHTRLANPHLKCHMVFTQRPLEEPAAEQELTKQIEEQITEDLRQAFQKSVQEGSASFLPAPERD
jgi:hypothetical protein